MKKFIIALSIAALTVSAYAMSKTPAEAEAHSTGKACVVKDAANCCTSDGSCKTEKTEASATKTVEEKAECAGGVCPLKK